MDYRKAWIELKTFVEDAVEEGRVNGYDDRSEPYRSGMYDAYKHTLNRMEKLEPEEVQQ